MPFHSQPLPSPQSPNSPNHFLNIMRTKYTCINICHIICWFFKKSLYSFFPHLWILLSYICTYIQMYTKNNLFNKQPSQQLPPSLCCCSSALSFRNHQEAGAKWNDDAGDGDDEDEDWWWRGEETMAWQKMREMPKTYGIFKFYANIYTHIIEYYTQSE